jgi:hypothetical protein
MLDTQMQKKGMHLDIIRCENIANIQPDKPILVLCINSSNLGTDATTAIEGIESKYKKYVLIGLFLDINCCIIQFMSFFSLF